MIGSQEVVIGLRSVFFYSKIFSFFIGAGKIKEGG
jgi:hypothetical protein